MQPKLHIVALLSLLSVDLACSQPTAQSAAGQDGSTLTSTTQTIYDDVRGNISAVADSIFPNQTDSTPSPETNLGMPNTCLNTEDKSGLLCYPKCPNDGHEWTGSGPLCWCKTESFPYFIVQGRGVGHPLRCPSDQEFSGFGCYSPCPAGHKRTGNRCDIT